MIPKGGGSPFILPVNYQFKVLRSVLESKILEVNVKYMLGECTHYIVEKILHPGTGILGWGLGVGWALVPSGESLQPKYLQLSLSRYPCHCVISFP